MTTENTGTGQNDQERELQTIDKSNVGDLGSVLGDASSILGTKPADGSAEQTGATGNDAKDVEKNDQVEQAPASQGNVTLTQLADEPEQAPAVVQQQATPTVRTVAPAVVKNTEVVGSLDQLAEYQAALKVCKPQSGPALAAILKYTQDMKPGVPQTEATIRANQLALYNALYIILNSEDTNFPTVYRGVVGLVKANLTGCFKVTMRNRGLNAMDVSVLDNPKMRFFTRLVDVLVQTAGAERIEDVKRHTDMKKFVETMLTPRMKANVTAFYSE